MSKPRMFLSTDCDGCKSYQTHEVDEIWAINDISYQADQDEPIKKVVGPPVVQWSGTCLHCLSVTVDLLPREIVHKNPGPITESAPVPTGRLPEFRPASKTTVPAEPVPVSPGYEH